jgi:hypothetical protein
MSPTLASRTCRVSTVDVNPAVGVVQTEIERLRFVL